MSSRSFILQLSSISAALCLIASTATAQSSSRIVYPQRGQIIQSSPVQRGGIIQGSTLQGSTLQGTTPGGTIIQGSTVQGSTTQGSAMQGSITKGPAMRVSETFESKFWRYLNDARYREWAPAPGTTGDAYAGESPHGAMLKMFLNRKAAGRPGELPHGSVIVKENYGPDGKTLMAVTTMYRPKSYQGWYWTKYNPDGSVASKDGKRLAGKVKGCIDCHSGAGGNDQAFFND